MPLTAFQKRVARILAANRNPDSHVAGGAVINRDESTLRYSNDLDIFHDVAESITASAHADVVTLLNSGYSVRWLTQTRTLHQAEVARDADRLRLDWSEDSAFRFFPAQPDADFGYCLHRADLATNKILALAGREVVRDFLDTLQLDQNYLSLGAIIWAACGKDQGYTPDLILQLANRHSRYQEIALNAEKLARPVDLRQLKRQWLEAMDRARSLFEGLPSEELGCLYLDATHTPVTPDPDSPAFSSLIRHQGSIRGAWPEIFG